MFYVEKRFLTFNKKVMLVLLYMLTKSITS